MPNQRLQIFLTVIMVALAEPASAARAKQTFNDAAITSAVKSDLRFGNELTVRPSMNLPPDADVEKGLLSALFWDPILAGAPIEVAVFHHVAYLGGTVDSAEQRAEAEDVASRTKGVVMVRNHLRIGSGTSYFFYGQDYKDFETFGPAPLKSDAQIQRDIERAFFWSPFVDQGDINVTVHDGLVTLTGTVGSWMGYGEAERDARKSGAVGVLNRLKVR
jgi:osmotically-inducible protein OsmY